ncbi:NmrA family NAD(P)-binding protein [Microbacterium sp. STN6]|uniref:NmrA family NAD(P)-binding protein n=1 Tax=Microbacterium sp. STN6 TaxID=2995588 RepID=UPI002260EC0A|nr:NmrA family NAD(P)-binding protein [Microbacterium sp. STN6]MCX7521396.1 NmrA family NAD(P)-binding protein [Microbacterium sp. STN6]
MILVTTAGKVGAHTARILASAGQPVRVIVRSPEAHQDLAAAGIELFRGNLDQPDSIAEALADVQSAVLVSPAVPAQEIAVIDAARKAGVAHVTKITSDAAPDSPIQRRRDHYRIEVALAESGIPHTLLRANAYMQNLLALAPAIAANSEFTSSTGDGRIGMVDARDVATVAAVIAPSPAEHAGKTYRLSGPARVSYDDVADQLTTILGRTITHRRITTEEQEAAMVELGLPTPVAHANAQALELFAHGDSDWTSPDVERIAGRPATSFSLFATDHAGRFSRADA